MRLRLSHYFVDIYVHKLNRVEQQPEKARNKPVLIAYQLVRLYGRELAPPLRRDVSVH